MNHTRLLALLACLSLLTSPLIGCAPEAEGSGTVTRETLANGATLVRYADLSLDHAPRISPDLEIGVLEGDAAEVFGDVRAVEVRDDGTILVLDYQASEIRAFGPDGAFLETIAARGDGPGELREVNGMVLKGDSVLWVQDHARWVMIALDPDGGELDRVPMHVRSYGYVWSGAVMDDGVHWKPMSHSDDERVFPPEPGLLNGSTRTYVKSFDPRTEEVDSVFTGERTYRTFVAESSRGGWSYRSIPFDGRGGFAIDPTGAFWSFDGADYRIAKLGLDGDTLLVIEADLPSVPVTDDDRQGYIEATAEQDPAMRPVARQIADLMNDTKPMIVGIRADASGNLWVRRAGGAGEDPVYDVFDPEGEHLGSVVLGFQALDFFPFVVRNGAIHTLTRDELDVPRVVRAPLPDLGR